MFKKIVLLLALFVIKVYPAFEIQILNPSFIARGGIVSIHPGSLNPAPILETNGINIGANYTHLFGLKALKCWGFYSSLNYKNKIGAALRINSLGNNAYQENMYEFAICKMIRKKIALGASLKYYDLLIVDFGRTGALGLNLGSKLYIGKKTRISLLYQNINTPRICNKTEALPQTFSIGFQWFAHRMLEINGELFKDTLFPFVPRGGIKVNFLKNISGYVGMQFDPDRLSGGISCHWKTLQFDFAILNHLALPCTYYFGCNFSIE